MKRDDETGNLECTLLIFDTLKMKLKEPGTQVVFHIFPRREEFVSTYESVAFCD